MRNTLCAAFLGCALATSAIANAGYSDENEYATEYDIDLSVAIYDRDYHAMQEALLNGADVNYGNAYSGSRGSPLRSAIYKEDADIVGFLIHSGALPYAEILNEVMDGLKKNPESPFLLEMKDYLFEEAAASLPPEELSKALLYMAFACDKEKAQQFLEAGADPNYQPYGPRMTPITSAIAYATLEEPGSEDQQNCIDTTAILLANGGDYDFALREGNLNEEKKAMLEQAQRRIAVLRR